MTGTSVFRTQNPKCDYSFSWEIENFHLTSLRVRGPAFTPIPGFEWKFYLEVEFKQNKKEGNEFCFSVTLGHYMPSSPRIKLQCEFTVANSQTTLFTSLNLDTVFEVQSNTTLMARYCTYGSSSQLGLYDGKLILAGTLTFSGYKVTTNTCPLLPQQPSVNHTELPKNIKTIYEGGLASEVVTFSIGDEKLSAHKAILCSHSPVFEKMFEHDMKENNTNKVTIGDADFCTFNSFLGFLYTGVVKEDKYEFVLSLYSVAKKYQVKSLQESCCSFLKNKLTVEYVCDTLVLADLHEDKELKEAVKIFVREIFLDLVGTSKWNELVTTHPRLTKEVLDYMKGKLK